MLRCIFLHPSTYDIKEPEIPVPREYNARYRFLTFIRSSIKRLTKPTHFDIISSIIILISILSPVHANGEYEVAFAKKTIYGIDLSFLRTTSMP